MAIHKVFATVELDDARVIGPLRVTIGARVAWDTYSRKRNIASVEQAQFTASLFWAWWELKRTGAIDYDFDAAMQGRIVDVEIERDPDDPEGEELAAPLDHTHA